MSNYVCPNCNRRTARTEDWACRWCGYPLPGGFYEKIDKTYRQLREEKLHKLPVEEEIEVPPPPVCDFLPPIEAAEPKPICEPETEPVEEPCKKTIAEPEPAPEPVQEPQAKPLPPAMEVSADELILAYSSDPTAADAKYTDQVINLTGIVSRVEIRQTFSIYYIFLTGTDEKLMRSVRCMFDKKCESELLQLTKEQTVTVQGKYNGSLIDFRMQNCIIVPQPPDTEEPV